MIYISFIKTKLNVNAVSKFIVDNSIEYFVQCFINNCRKPFRSQLAARNSRKLTDILNLVTNDLNIFIHNKKHSNKPCHHRLNIKYSSISLSVCCLTFQDSEPMALLFFNHFVLLFAFITA